MSNKEIIEKLIENGAENEEKAKSILHWNYAFAIFASLVGIFGVFLLIIPLTLLFRWLLLDPLLGIVLILIIGILVYKKCNLKKVDKDVFSTLGILLAYFFGSLICSSIFNILCNYLFKFFDIDDLVMGCVLICSIILSPILFVFIHRCYIEHNFEKVISRINIVKGLTIVSISVFSLSILLLIGFIVAALNAFRGFAIPNIFGSMG